MTKKPLFNVKHPAKYSDEILPIFEFFLRDKKEVLDPFAGVGKLRKVRQDAILLEIEKEWAEQSGAMVGSVLSMPESWVNRFDAICTSPTYGNRMADHFNAKDASKRNTYRHTLGRPLHEDNSGRLQWGEKYRGFHLKAWEACKTVLKEKGTLIINISDHIRNGEVQSVSAWHLNTLERLGFVLKYHIKVVTKRNRYGSNRELRVGHENIFVMEKEQ